MTRSSPTSPAIAIVAAALLSSTTACAAELERSLPIVDRAIAFHGGEVYRNSEVGLEICSRGGCFHITARVVGGLFGYDVVEAGDDGLRVRVSNDSVAVHRGDRAVPVTVASEQKWRDWVSQRVYFPFLPFRLADESVYKEDLGLVDWRGRRLHKVKIHFEPGSSSSASDNYLFWFDPETGRVEMFAYSFHGDPGGLRFRRAHNYRRVEGMLFYDQENLGVDADGLTVDLIDPAYVDEQMRPISDVQLRRIEVVAPAP